jgi:hypothetical protein
MSRFLVFAATLVAARTASADVTIAGDAAAPSPPPAASSGERRFDARAGFLLGGSDTGDADGLSMGIHGQLGFRAGDATLFGELDYYSVGDSAGEENRRIGRTSRAGLTLRYSLLNDRRTANGTMPIGGDLWVEAGAGYEHVAWKKGGVLRRPDLALGIGVEMDGRPGAKRGERPKQHIGYYLAFRTLIARAPESDEPAMCGGPCSEPTQPPRTDVSLYFVVGLHWGRSN